MTAPLPPIKSVRGRPAVELVNTNADSPLVPAGDADIFSALSTHWLIYPIALAGFGSVQQFFPPFTEGHASPPDAGPVSVLEAHNRLILTGAAGGVGVESPNPAFFNSQLFAITCDPASAVPTWRFHARFGHRDAAPGNRMFVGLSDGSGDVTLGASAYIGIRARATDTHYQFSYSDGVAAPTFIDLGVPVAFWTATDGDFSAVMPVQLFDLFIFSTKGTAGFAWRVINALTHTVAGEGTVATGGPSATTVLGYYGKARGQIISTLLDQWKQGIELLPIQAVFYADFPFGPAGVDARGGTAAVPSGGGGGGGVSPSLPWAEDFDEADYPALVTKYADAASYSWEDPAPGIRVTGGALELDGKGAGDYFGISFSPPALTTPVREWWAKMQFSVVGGAYDVSNDPLFLSAWNSLTGDIELDLGTYGVSNPTNLYNVSLYAATSATALSTFPRFLPAGDYTMIVCASEDDATTQRAELWINATAGAAADAVVTMTKPSGAGFDVFHFGVDGPTATGRMLRVLPFSIVAGTRASDPFGIL